MFKQNLVTNVWKYKLKERTRYQLKSTERNNYLIECNFTGNYTTRVKEEKELTEDQLKTRYVGKQDPKKHLEDAVIGRMEENAVTLLSSNVDKIAFK